MVLLCLMLKKLQKQFFYTYFYNTVRKSPTNLAMKELSIELFTDPVKLTVERFKDHPNIASAMNKITSIDNPKFGFRRIQQNKP